MPQKQILLPLEVTLRLRIALLERDLAHLQAQLLRATADQQHAATLQQLLTHASVRVPVPLAQCTFDYERGALVYGEGEHATDR